MFSRQRKAVGWVLGSWNDPYSGKTITAASQLDIDHLVPLKEAHESSGHSWDSERRRAYANDLSDSNTLIAVDRGLNRQKGAGDPVQIGYRQIKLIRKNMRELG